MRLKEKVAIITGAGRGIGLATAVRFMEEGASVVIADIDQELVAQVAEDLNQKAGFSANGHVAQPETVSRAGSNGGSNGASTAVAVAIRALPVFVNVADPESCRTMVQKTLDTFGRVDVLVNNAGIVRDARLVKMSEAEFDAVINVNLKGVYNCSKAVADTMVAQGSGVILNAASIVATYGNFGQTNYVAAKAGVIGMTKVWARELGRKGVRVNAVAPGFIRTRMTDGIPDKVMETIEQRIPLGYRGEPEDIANAYVWLASDEARYVNGHTLAVDGGATL